MLERTLTAEGYAVEAAADGGAALAAVERNLPDAIVLDVTMPGIDGLAVTRRLRAKGLRVPILLLTARDAVAERVAGLDAGRRRLPGQAVRPRRAVRAGPGAAAPQRAAVGGRRARVRRPDAASTGIARRAATTSSSPAARRSCSSCCCATPAGVVTRELALEEVWGGEHEATPNAVDRYVGYLRRKLGDPPLDPHGPRRRLPPGPRGDERLRARAGDARARVAVAAAVAIALAVVLLVIAVPKLLEADLRGELDDRLRRRPRRSRGSTRTVPGQLTEAGALEGGGLLRAGRGPGSRIVARSRALGGRVLPIDQDVLRDRQPRLADARLGTDPVRVFTAPLGELGAGRGERRRGRSSASDLGVVEHTVDRARVLIAICALVAALIAAALATWLTRRALRPLTRLNAGAREIGRAGDPSQRLPEPPITDEVGELAHTLNAMLASLERAQEAEHRFVGDASHELRTPLTALRGNAAYLAKHGPDEAVVQDIADGAERLSSLLDDLLALAREDAAAPLHAEPVRARGAGRTARSSSTTPGSSGEREALQRAVDNLVRNAHKHGTRRRHGHRRRRRHRGLHRRPRTKAPAPTDLRPCLRALPPRASGARRGLGLGLAIVRRSPSATAAASRSTARAYARPARPTAGTDPRFGGRAESVVGGNSTTIAAVGRRTDRWCPASGRRRRSTIGLAEVEEAGGARCAPAPATIRPTRPRRAGAARAGGGGARGGARGGRGVGGRGVRSAVGPRARGGAPRPPPVARAARGGRRGARPPRRPSPSGPATLWPGEGVSVSMDAATYALPDPRCNGDGPLRA